MKTVVAAPQVLWDELNTTLKLSNCIRVEDAAEFDRYSDDDVFFNLYDGSHKVSYRKSNAPVFINSTCYTLKENQLAANVYRLNCWTGFLKRPKWEVAGEVSDKLSAYLVTINKEAISCPDMPGFISSRVISMIINEAYFTLEEGVSTKAEIDIAMKLGTNYPKGPFEWSQEIGLNNVVELLTTLSKEDKRYAPAPWLIKDCK